MAALASIPIILLCKVVRSTLGNVVNYRGKINFCRPIFESYDLSIGSTETKFIKLKTKTQNNIVIFGIFHKK